MTESGKEPMKRYSYQLTFHTPAFLGGANQSGEWRTPPFKALLRQWWRVAISSAAGHRLAVGMLRAKEDQLFGTAADEKGGVKGRSQVLLRLSHWKQGGMGCWERLSPPVEHPEVKDRDGQLKPVGADLYLGYGPLIFQGGTQLKSGAAIQAGDAAILSLAFPQSLEAEIRAALLLMNKFATVGGRSRNGWGSFSLTPADDATPALTDPLAPEWIRPWREALDRDWPHAIGEKDGRPLIWYTNSTFASWREAMVELAKIKIGMRTQFKFPPVRPPHDRPEDRHWLSYPVTKHNVSSWGNNARLSNSLRFKIRPDKDDKVRAWIVHMPCIPPDGIFRSSASRPAIEKVWHQVHAYLDNQNPGKHGALGRAK